MVSEGKRAHGVTPGLRRDYAARTAGHQAAFVLPYLHPGMHLLDLGCGPGTITLGLAQAVAPGHVTGIDYDAAHIEAAPTLVAERGVTNVTFQAGEALSLFFEDGTFDAAFENDLFMYLSQNAVQAATEAYRVLKPGGFFGTRDVDADSVVRGHPSEPIKQLDRLFTRWHQSPGSDITLGKQLPTILRQAGFTGTLKSVSADTKGDPEATRSHAEITVFLVEQLKEIIRAWNEHPDAFFANVHVEVIGWKPG